MTEKQMERTYYIKTNLKHISTYNNKLEKVPFLQRFPDKHLAL